MSVGKKPLQETGIKVKNHSSLLSLAHRRDFKQLLQGITGEGPLRLADINFKEFAGFQIALPNKVGVREQHEASLLCVMANSLKRILDVHVTAGSKASNLPQRLRHPKTKSSRSAHPNALKLVADVFETKPGPRRRCVSVHDCAVETPRHKHDTTNDLN